MASTFAPCAMMAIMLHVIAPGIDLPSVIHRSITPYKPEGWRQALSSAGLTHLFPHLIHNIIYGSPIGNPPPLTYTFIPANLKSTDMDPVYMLIVSSKRRWLPAALTGRSLYRRHT